MAGVQISNPATKRNRNLDARLIMVFSLIRLSFDGLVATLILLYMQQAVCRRDPSRQILGIEAENILFLKENRLTLKSGNCRKRTDEK